VKISGGDSIEFLSGLRETVALIACVAEKTKGLSIGLEPLD
jgi:hypothetical protein